jgi:2'-5' RNA ligase
VVEGIAALDRPRSPGLRWTGPEQWHVTLAFIGSVAGPAVDGVAAGLAGLRAPVAAAVLGPATARLGRAVLVVPVAGLDALAAAVAAVVPPGPDTGRPFTGHLTLARASGRRGVVPPALAGTPVSARWEVAEVALVRSRPGRSGSRYETLAVVGLGAGEKGP